MRLSPLPLLLALGGCLGEGPYIKRELQKTFEDHALHARADLLDLVQSPAEVELAAATDIPLVTLDPADRRAFIEVLTADPKSSELKTWVFMVDPGAAGVFVSDAFAEAHGAKPKDVNLNGIETASVASGRLAGLTAGGLTLRNVRARAGFKGSSGDFTVDGLLGLGAFPELAGAVLHSQGVLRLAPADQGEALLAAVKGERMSYRGTVAEQHRDGSRKWLNEPYPLVVDLRFQGRPARAALRLAGGRASLGNAVGVVARGFAQGEPLLSAGGSRVFAGPLELGEGGAVQGLFREVPGESYDRVPLDLAVNLGNLGGVDLAWSPASGTLALGLVAGKSPLGERPALDSRVLERLIAESAKALEPDPTTGESPKPQAVAATSLELAGLYARRPGLEDKALAALDAAVAADDKDCATHLARGEWLLGQGRHAEAVGSLEQAAALYGAWAELPRSDRDKVKADKARVEKQGDEYHGVIPQANACHTAWGLWAEGALAQGGHDVVGSLYAAHLGLDPHLPLVAASSTLLQGRLVEAEAALRQASSRTGPNNPEVGAGLALVFARQGRSEQALELLGRVVLSSQGGVLESWLFSQIAVSALGAEEALARLEGLSAKAPALVGPRLAWIELATRLGRDQDAALNQTLAELERLAAPPAWDADVLGAYAWALALADRDDEARESARLALEADPQQLVALATLVGLGDSSLKERALKAAVGSPAALALLAEGDGI